MAKEMGLFGKLSKKEETKTVNTAFKALSNAYANMFLPTIAFEKYKTKELILKAKKALDKVV